MLDNWEIKGENVNEENIPYNYLLKSKEVSDLYCIVNIDNDVPKLLSYFKKSEMLPEFQSFNYDENSIMKYLQDNLSTDDILSLINNFYIPDEIITKKYILNL